MIKKCKCRVVRIGTFIYHESRCPQSITATNQARQSREALALWSILLALIATGGYLVAHWPQILSAWGSL